MNKLVARRINIFNNKVVHILASEGELTEKLIYNVNRLYSCIEGFYLVTEEGYRLLNDEEYTDLLRKMGSENVE